MLASRALCTIAVVLSFSASTAFAETVAAPAVRPWRAAALAQPYMFVSWALRPDGKAAVYVLQSEREGSAALVHQNFPDGSLTEIAQDVPRGARARDLQPRWSPDGAQVAYLFPQDGAWRLHVWRGKDGSTRRFPSRTACVSGNRNGCRHGQIEWSPDSRYVYFLAAPADAPPILSNPAERQHADREWRRLLYADPQNGGVTVRRSARAQSETASSPTRSSSAVTSEVVAADTRSGEIVTLFKGAGLTGLTLAPNGRQMLAVAQSRHEQGVRQQYVDYYLFAARRAQPARRLLEHVPEGPFAWSPGSDRVAFIGNGALAAGDLSVVHVASGRVVNLTQETEFLEFGEVREIVPETARTSETPGSKLGGAASLAWTPAGDAVYVLRRARIDKEWRTRLWKLSSNGEAVNVTEGAGFDAELPLFGEIVPIRRPRGEGGFVSLAAIEHRSPELHGIDGGFRELGYPSPFAHASKAALFVSESAHAWSEAFLIERDSGAIVPVTSINVPATPVRLPTRRRIEWRAPSGATYFGHLYLHESQRPAPLIVDIYPRGPYERPLSDTTYIGRLSGFHLPLWDFLEAGYALFTPDLPVAGDGKTCEDTARNMELALDAIRRVPGVQADNAAIVGHSFGGWAVNCVITRSRRFRAAISIAGAADLITTSFSPVSNVASWGIGGGQTRIGKSIWDAAELYWQESPISGARAVTTPLLLLHGKLDDSVPVVEAAKMYTALSRLGKDVTLVAYDDADHASVLSHPDFKPRITSWIQTHLIR